MTFSIRINNDLPTEALIDLARAAEAGGFDQLWVSNDVLLRSAPVLVAALATHTNTIGLGIGDELARTRQAVTVLRALLGHRGVDPVDLPDYHEHHRGLQIPVEVPVPVYVGAMGPAMLAMAGACADGVLPLLYPPEHSLTPAIRSRPAGGLPAGSTDRSICPPASGCRSPMTGRPAGPRWPRSSPTTGRPSRRCCSPRRD